jgi:hypothetical protein
VRCIQSGCPCEFAFGLFGQPLFAIDGAQLKMQGCILRKLAHGKLKGRKRLALAVWTGSVSRPMLTL